MTSSKAKANLARVVPTCALGLTAIYTAIDWLLVERTGWVSLDQDVIRIWLPLAFALALMLVFVSRRTALIREGKRGAVRSVYWALALAIIALPTIIAQFYMHAASGTLTHISNAADAAAHQGQYYFRADTICLDRRRIAFIPIFEATGHNSENLSVHVYTAVPLCNRTGVYLGLDYAHNIDNRLPVDQKETLYRAFLRECDAKLRAENPSHYTYLELVRPSAALRAYEKALARHGVVGSQIILAPRAEPFDRRAGKLPLWLAGVLGGGTLLWLFMALIAPIDAETLHASGTRDDADGTDRLAPGEWVHVLLFSWGLWALVGINALVYVAMVLSGLGVLSVQPDDLINWGGNYPPALHGWGWLRLISSQFVHSGLMHILGNIYGLVFASIFLGPIIGNLRFVLSYLFCGVMAGMASAIYHPQIVSVGASGAIFGLFGILLACLFFDKGLKEARGPILLNVGIYLGYNLVVGAAIPGIDFVAHIGGLVAGLLLGSAFCVWNPIALAEPDEAGEGR